MSHRVLSIQEFMSYKDYNKEIHPSIRKQSSNLKFSVKGKKMPRTHKNNNDWSSNHQRIEQQKDEKEKFINNVTLLLNQLAEENYDVILQNFLKLDSNTKNKMEAIVDLIINYVISRKSNVIYAKLSFDIIAHKKEIKSVLLKKCQQLFQNKIEKDDEPNENKINILNFIGELYNYHIINMNIIKYCCNSLFTICQKNTEMITIMCSFIRVIIKKLHFQSNFNFVEKLEELKNSDISKREKFAIMDILDIMKNNINL